MPMFGTTVSAYNKKPNTALSSFSTRKFAPAVSKPTVPTNNPSVSPVTASLKPVPGDYSKSAVSGSSTMNASGLIGTVSPSVFQPRETGQIGVRETEGLQGSYNRLGAIDQRTQVLNDEMDAKVAAFNRAANQRNALAQQQNFGGGDLFEGGDGSGLDSEQLQYARQIASVGKSRGMGDDAIQIALMTALAESGLRNINYGDRDSVGLFQQRTSQGWGSIDQIMDPNYSANKFYDSLAKTNYKGMTPWQAAQSVQRSFDPTGSNYQRQYSLAQRAFQSLTPRQQGMGLNYNSSTVGKTNSAAGFIQGYNNRYVDYDGSFGAQCVDMYNAYTAKFVGGKNIMVNWAPELFNAYDRTAYNRYGAGQTPGRMGDVAVFNRSAALPGGHVAIVVGDNGNGTLRVLHSNATSLRERGPSIISNISKADLMGYLRPKRLM